MPAAISISGVEDAAFSDIAHQKLITCLRRTPPLGRACVFVLWLSAFVHRGPCNFNVFSFAATAPCVISSNCGTSLFLAESYNKPAAPYTYSTPNCRQRQEPAGGQRVLIVLIGGVVVLININTEGGASAHFLPHKILYCMLCVVI